MLKALEELGWQPYCIAGASIGAASDATFFEQLLNDGKSASQRDKLKQAGEHYWLLQPLLNETKAAGN